MNKIIEFSPAYDMRDPNPKKNYGIHGVDCKFVLKGELGAIQFLLFTNWFLPHLNQKPSSPLPADISYHSPKPMYEGQSSIDDCEYIGGKCYYDGSSLRADKFFEILVAEGSDGLWKELENEYVSIFGELK